MLTYDITAARILLHIDERFHCKLVAGDVEVTNRNSTVGSGKFQALGKHCIGDKAKKHTNSEWRNTVITQRQASFHMCSHFFSLRERNGLNENADCLRH